MKVFKDKKGGWSLAALWEGIKALWGTTIGGTTSATGAIVGGTTVGVIATWTAAAIAVLAVVAVGYNLLGANAGCSDVCIETGFEEGGFCGMVNLLGSQCPGKTKLSDACDEKAGCAIGSRCCCTGENTNCKRDDGTLKECGTDKNGESCGNCAEDFGETFECDEDFYCVDQDNLCELKCEDYVTKECGQGSCGPNELLFERTCEDAVLEKCETFKCEVSDQCDNIPDPGPSGECTVGSADICRNFDLYECVNQGEGQGKWILRDPKSLDCAPDDGDFSATKCVQKNGDWLNSAPVDYDWDLNGYCCGDDSNSDMGESFSKGICVNDDGFKWLEGIEGKRDLNNKVVFCGNNFYFCKENLGYTIQALPSCTADKCGYFCDVRTGEWTSDQEYEAMLKGTLKEGELINTIKEDSNDNSACCPKDWCFNGEQCIGNQKNDACSSSVYTVKHTTTNDGVIEADFRCIDGNWELAIESPTWDKKKKGYCPEASDCFVGCEFSESNYDSDSYFTNKPPQCIGHSQYILDNYCSAGNWISRSSVIATKMIQIEKSKLSDNYIVYCDDVDSTMNDLNFLVKGKTLSRFIGDNCEKNGQPVKCVNNFCIAKSLSNGQIMFGVSLNKALFSIDGFSELLDIDQCADTSTDEYDYNKCKDNVLYNSKVNSVIYSDVRIADPDSPGAYDIFKQILKNPILMFKNLMKEKKVYYVHKVGNVKLEIPMLTDSPTFNKLFVLESGIKDIRGVMELNKFDPEDNKTTNYMMVEYNGFDEDMCEIINEFSFNSDLKHTTCSIKTDEPTLKNAYVFQANERLTYLMHHWQDLTSKIKIE
jgi:hypothetical protein